MPQQINIDNLNNAINTIYEWDLDSINPVLLSNLDDLTLEARALIEVAEEMEENRSVLIESARLTAVDLVRAEETIVDMEDVIEQLTDNYRDLQSEVDELRQENEDLKIQLEEYDD